MNSQETKALDLGLGLENEDISQKELGEMGNTAYATDEKKEPPPHDSKPGAGTLTLDEEHLATKPNGRFRRACLALDHYLARTLGRRHYTLSEYLVRAIPGFVTGLLISMAWWWIKLGWRPWFWTRTAEEQALWCRSSTFERMFL